jgi:hypothetical protein
MTRFCWGLGGVAGAIIGGSCECRIGRHTGLTDGVLVEKPADKWPDVFGKVPLLVEYPYLLPCTLAASITLTGSFMDDVILREITHCFQGLSCRCFLDPTVDRGTVQFAYHRKSLIIGT